MSRFDSSTRTVGLDHNPLRRRSDRVEWWIRFATTMIVVLVAPIVAGFAASSAYAAGIRAEAAERSSRQLTQAVLAQDATYSSSATGAVSTVLTYASWKAPDDTPRTGWIRAKIGATAGTAIPIWIDTQGVPTNPPRGHDQTLAVTTATAILIPIGAALLFGIGFLIVRAILDRRRLAQWQAAWLAIEPKWSGRTA